jgi:hypothetical protein
MFAEIDDCAFFQVVIIHLVCNLVEGSWNEVGSFQNLLEEFPVEHVYSSLDEGDGNRDLVPQLFKLGWVEEQCDLQK